MGELDREPPRTTSRPLRCAVVGGGRLGTALAAALAGSGHEVEGPLGRGSGAAGCDVALLCVPDGEIAAAAAAVVPGPVVGHCSGALGLDVLGPRDGFSMHPLMTVTAQGARLRGAGCAVAGSSPRTLGIAEALACDLGMRPVHLDEEDRAAYHAAASIASNYLVTLEAAAERVAATAGLERAHLVALVRATVDNWAALGPARALTGPLARGDEQTVARQRAAVVERAPELVGLFDALADATRSLATEAAPA
jgi:predicted short-subunit dehydrogenase-like oxidoreductase (DUF2520 family)